jgi:DNA-binding transcriptional ArsR family regulator
MTNALDASCFAAILNHMVKYGEPTLDRTFAALADPTRRALLARLRKQDGISVSELAQPFAMSLPAIMKHLDVLSDAGLVARAKTGRVVTCRLTAGPMEQAMDWLNRYQRFWSESLGRLAAFVEEEQWPSSQTQPAPPASSTNRASPSNVVSMPRRRKSTRRGPTRKK